MAGLGFPAEAPSVYEFPIEMFFADSDLTPLKENIDKIVYGLTKWEPTIKEKGVFAAPKVTVTGGDYEKALTTMGHLFLKNLWSEGLPITPATKEKVDWILTGTDLSRDAIVGEGKILPRGGVASVEAIAVALAMAGGRPEYLPVLIAAVEAFTKPEFGHESMNATTNSVAPAMIVNGPIAREIRLGSGYGCLGPHPIYPAGSAIGRASRLILLNLGGGIPGIGSMALFGGFRVTNVVFAEDEAGLPEGWEPLAVDRGFPRGANVVTVTPVASQTNIAVANPIGTKEDNDATLWGVAKHMNPHSSNAHRKDVDTKKPDLAAGVVLLARGLAQTLAEASGYSKRDVKKVLWENTKIPWSEVVKVNLEQQAENAGISPGQDLPLTDNPDQLMIVVAGGEQSRHQLWMGVGHSNYTVVSAEIQLPANWDELLAQAEEDLGSLPAD